MSEHLDTALVDTWFAAWSRSRGYRTSPEAGRRAALRT
ncbi:N-acetyltransferase, partial [Micrococcus endophyticus]